MNKFLFTVLLLPSLAFAHPQAATLTCQSDGKDVPVTLSVSNSPMGDGGLVVDVGGKEYQVTQNGTDENVAGNVQWGRNLPDGLTVMSLSASGVNLELSEVPLNIKYDFLNTPNGEFSHEFNAHITASVEGESAQDVALKCQYQNIPGMNE